MNKQLLALLFLIAVICTSATEKPKPQCYKNKKTYLSGKSVSKLTDHYLALKKGNYFKLYQRIFGLTKMVAYKGTFTQHGDSLILRFCGDTMTKDLTGKAYIDNTQRKIILFATDTTYNQHFYFRKDKR